MTEQVNSSPVGEQRVFLHHIAHHAVPAAPVRQGAEPGRAPGVAHDDTRGSVSSSSSPSPYSSLLSHDLVSMSLGLNNESKHYPDYLNV